MLPFLTVERIHADKDKYRVDGAPGTKPLVDSAFLLSEHDRGEVVQLKRFVVDMTSHHADRTSPVTLILSARGNIGTVRTPPGACIGASRVLEILDRSYQVFRHGAGNWHDALRYMHPVGHRNRNELIVFGVEDVGALADILHHAKDHGGIEEDGRLRGLERW